MLNTVRHILSSELRPFEGRMATAWRVAALCALTTLVFMTYGIPLAPIACYLVLFVMKPDPAESILMAIGISILVSIVVVVLVLLTRWSIEVPLWRMVILATASFLFLYIGAASQLGPAGSIIALVIAFIMTLIGDVPVGELATRALLYAWLMALVPMGLIITFNAGFGRSAVKLLRKGLAKRLRLSARALAEDSISVNEEMRTVMSEGNETLQSYARFVRLFHLVPRAEIDALTAGIMRSYMMLLSIHVSRKTEHDSHATRNDLTRQRLEQRCRDLADTVEKGQLRGNQQYDRTVLGNNNVLDSHLSNFTEPVPADPDTAKAGFFYADALTNPTYQHFALKTTGAAILCYLIYTALDWQDIHTAMVTCYVAALGTTGETLHKLTLRIVGCLIGAAMGIFSILFLMPHMTSIDELMVLVFVGTLGAAWVSSGSERISYAGVQVGLAFLLTVLQGFGPDVHLSVATDRIIGILLGNTVLFLVFTYVWPVSAVQTVQRKLSDVLDTLQRQVDKPVSFEVQLPPDQVAQALGALASSKEELKLVHFEPQNIRPSKIDVLRLGSLIEKLESLSLKMAVPDTTTATTEVTDTTSSLAKHGVDRWKAQVNQMRHALQTSSP